MDQESATYANLTSYEKSMIRCALRAYEDALLTEPDGTPLRTVKHCRALRGKLERAIRLRGKKE